MVAEDRTGQRGADGDEEERVALLVDAQDDGQDESHGAPGGAHGKGDERRHDGDDRREQVQRCPHAREEAGHELSRAEHVAAHAAQAPRQDEDHDGAHHGAHALGEAGDKAVQRHELARQEHGRGRHEGDARADAQARHRVFPDGGAKVHACKEAARVEHAHDGEHDEDEQRHHEVEHAALLGDGQALVLLKVSRDGGGVVDVGLLGHDGGNLHAPFQLLVGLVAQAGAGHGLQGAPLLGDAPPGDDSPAGALGLEHEAEVPPGERDQEDEIDGEQGVQVVRDRRHERVEAVLAQVATHGHGPGGHGRDDAHRRRHGVDNPGKLLAADLEAVQDRAHHRAHREAVEVVVDEDEDAEQGREHLGKPCVVHVFGHPARVGARPAGHSYDHRKGTQQRQEQDE